MKANTFKKLKENPLMQKMHIPNSIKKPYTTLYSPLQHSTFNILHSSFPMPLLFLDTETTDKNESARLIQLAYKSTETGEAVNVYFKPPVPISYGAMAVHHITEKMVAEKPSFEGSEVKHRLIDLLGNHILVAHNAPFDLKTLTNEEIEVSQYIDTLRLAKHLIESDQYNLQYLRYSLHLDAEGLPHDAMGDVIILEALFEYLANTIQEKFALQCTDDVMKKMLELTKTPILMKTFTFGKHLSKTFEEVRQTDRGYLEWLLGSESKKAPETQNEELVYTLQHHLK